MDDTLSSSSPRLARAGTKNAANGPPRVRQGQSTIIDMAELEEYGQKVSEREVERCTATTTTNTLPPPPQIDDLIAGKVDEDLANKLESHHLFVWVERHMQSNHKMAPDVEAGDDGKRVINEGVFQKTYDVRGVGQRFDYHNNLTLSHSPLHTAHCPPHEEHQAASKPSH